jgi:hypothetical protein
VTTPAASSKLAGGVGTEIKKILAGIGIKPCGRCKALAEQWDAAGIAWCRQNQQTLVDFLTTQATARAWVVGWAAAKLTAPGIIQQAIEQAAASQSPQSLPAPT